MVGTAKHHHHHPAPTTTTTRQSPQGRAKGVAFASDDATPQPSRAVYQERAHSASLSSQDSCDDDLMDTLLSASSIAHADTLSSSGHSTAMTSATTYDDRPSPDVPPSASPAPYAHPTISLLELVSNTASSSALPDSFDVNVSRKGGFVAVYSASNLFLIKTLELPRLWARTLQVKRKPVAIDITEDGFLLAVLSRPSQVDLYEIHGEGNDQIKKRRTIMLVHEAGSVVVSPDARILITGNKFGIEVIAIGPEVPETLRRTLSGPAGDALEFSDDGRTLLITGYARKSDGSALFVLPGLYDGPLTEEGEPIPQPPEAAWTGSVLFPETARIARQATLLPDADTGTFNELFAFNSEEDSWGIYDIACQRFTQRKMFLPDHQRWTRSEFVDDAMPAVSPNADLAAVALRIQGTTNIWIYKVPGWDYNPAEKEKLDTPIQPCYCIPIPSDHAAMMQEICVLRWVRLNANVQRLVAVGNSSIVPNENEVPGAPLGSKGVLVVLDFDKTKPLGYTPPTPLKTEYDLDPLCPGEMLPEGLIDFDREVELVRTRTIAQRRAQDRSGSTSRRNSRIGSRPVHRSQTNRNAPRPAMASDDAEELTPEEAQAMFEVPYDNQQPRSQTSLARAATVAAVSPANRRHLRALPFRPLEYRRADGHRELPHESDADNWVPPPPAYTATAAAAESVSLSHPDAPPVPAVPSMNPATVPSVPALPTMPAVGSPSPMPSRPYQHRQQSISSSISSSHTAQDSRRPSLIHPSTYPAPQASDPVHRRRSSANRPAGNQAPYSALPSTQNIYPAPSTSAPRSLPHQHPVRSPFTEHTNLDLYSSPAGPSLNPPASSIRHVSAPQPAPQVATQIQRRPVPQPTIAPVPHTTTNMPPFVPRATVDPRNAALPSLIPPPTNLFSGPGQQLPNSAPPCSTHPASFAHRAAATQGRGNSLSARSGVTRMDHGLVSDGKDKAKKKEKRKTACVVM
ncbi:hypothetical protein yc1106_03483 [Curvularia clavata]|uniref:DUF7165 domain-containing protein n=1 Tax=Curvularia clavata TaxID=95742 RepID=A0A9Q9DRZ2_CURCL|nr:hypothetical protein yc1106_03483 [Curvularia clavata]